MKVKIRPGGPDEWDGRQGEPVSGGSALEGEQTNAVMRDWATAVADYQAWARTYRRASPNTLTTRRQQLALLARAFGGRPAEVTTDALLDYFGRLEVAPNTYRSRRTTVRAFYAWAVEAGMVERSPAATIPAGTMPAPNPRPAPDSVVAQAWLAADERVRLMIRLAAEHGLRRGEVALVHSRDVLEDLDGWSLLVHGKGGRERHVPLNPGTAAALRRLPYGWAFPGRIEGHLSARRVGELVGEVMPGAWTMHKLRHRAGTLFYERSGGDILVAMELLGHASPVTTRAYVRANRTRLRAAVEGRDGLAS